MTRFLFVSYAATGHLNPTLSVARALVQRGHDVAVLTAEEARGVVESHGVKCCATNRWVATVGDIGPQKEALSPLQSVRRLRWLLREKFFNQAANQVGDLREVLVSWPADLVISSEVVPGVSIAMEAEKRPWATLAVEVTCTLPSRELFPWGTAMPVPRTMLQKAAAALLRWIYARFSRSLEREWSAIRNRYGLPKCGHLAESFGSPYLYLIPGSADFDAPRSDLQPQVHYTGPCLPLPASGEEWQCPFASDLPLVYGTAGTVFNDPELLLKLIESARGQPFNLFVTLGKNRHPAEFPNLPPNVHVASFVPQDLVLTRASAIVSNGGSGAVIGALFRGLPLVLLPLSADQPENARRCVERGVGIQIRARPLKVEVIRAAILKVLSEPSYRQRAGQLSVRLAVQDGPKQGADLLEQLAHQRTPLLRTSDAYSASSLSPLPRT